MSICIESYCTNCDFSYLGGHSIGYFTYQFKAICKSCLTNFFIYSEDLHYLKPEIPCFLHTEPIDWDYKYKILDKSEEKLWKRRIKRAKKDEKKQIKLERSRLISTRMHNILAEQVKTGIVLEAMQKDGWLKLNLDNISCPKCHALGKISMGFKENEICPRCKQGKIKKYH